jgi:Helix-loop-helix DNA-binding domain
VERRYRENLNNNIAELHLTLMNTKRVGSNMPENQHEDTDIHQQDLPKMCKGDIMLEAVAYVHQTEVELRHMADEIELLTTRVRQLEKLVKCEDCSQVEIGFDIYAG